MVTEPQWKGCFFSVLTSLSAWQSSGISSSWNSGRLLRDYKWLKRMNGFKEVKRSCAKSPTKTCKHGKSEDTQRIMCCHGLPFKPQTGHWQPETWDLTGWKVQVWFFKLGVPGMTSRRLITPDAFPASFINHQLKHFQTSRDLRPLQSPRIKYFFIAVPAEHRAV